MLLASSRRWSNTNLRLSAQLAQCAAPRKRVADLKPRHDCRLGVQLTVLTFHGQCSRIQEEIAKGKGAVAASTALLVLLCKIWGDKSANHVTCSSAADFSSCLLQRHEPSSDQEFIDHEEQKQAAGRIDGHKMLDGPCLTALERSSEILGALPVVELSQHVRIEVSTALEISAHGPTFRWFSEVREQDRPLPKPLSGRTTAVAALE